MSDSRRLPPSEHDLDQQLRALPPLVRFPPTPDLASTVQTFIAAQAALSTPVRPERVWLRTRRLAVAAMVLLLLAVGALIAFPQARSSLAKRFGVDGIEIIFVDETPTPAASPIGISLVLGDEMSLDEAQSSVDFPVQVPAVYGEPDEIYVRELQSETVVTLLYRPRANLPMAAETGVGALLMEFATSNRPADIAKRVSMGSGMVEEVSINNGFGYWVTGQSELVIYQDPTEDYEDFASRDSANVLIWEADGVTYRLESALGQDDAVLAAESLAPGVPNNSTPSQP
jgi:hypothetical protein